MKYFLSFLIFLLFACSSKTNTPDYVIPKEKMVDIIVDIHLTDGMFTVNTIRKEYTRKDSVNYYDKILDNYGYTRKDFDTSVYFYSININEYNKIYIEVLNRLNEIETEVKQQMSKDTIQN